MSDCRSGCWSWSARALCAVVLMCLASFEITHAVVIQRLNTLVYQPGSVASWDEAGVTLHVPQGSVARYYPSLSNIWVYTAVMPDAATANLTTAILQQSPLQLTASSALSIISTFCLHNGTTLQEVIRAAPYYLLNDNTITADILYANTSSYAATYAGATGAFHSINTSNLANITLLADQEFGLGVSVATISANMSSRNLAIIAQTVMSSLTLTAPRVPYNNSFFSWSDYINGQKLNVTSLLPRASLNSQFNANSDGSCQAVVQGTVQRQGLWNVTGQCLAEIRSQGNTHHKLQHETATGNVYMAAQKFELSMSLPAAPAPGPSGLLSNSSNVTDIQEGSPCTYTQANGTAVMPQPCSSSCLLANGSAAQPTLSCTIGNSSDMTCTTCAGALGNIPLFDLEALPAATGDQGVAACTSECNQLTYLTMLEGIPSNLCNTSCIANEQAWAAATLSQAANKSASCNATCQAVHDSFIASIQSPLTATTARRHRSLLQGTAACTPVQSCILCDTPCTDPLCQCSVTLDFFGATGQVAATCQAHPAGTVFKLDDNGCPPEPQPPYVPPPIPGQCENPPAMFCSNCLNGNDLNGNPVNDATRCSDPIYDDPPPSGKIIRYLCDTCGDSTVGLNHGQCYTNSNGVYQCAGNGCAANDRTCQGGCGSCSGRSPSPNVGSIITSALEIVVAIA